VKNKNWFDENVIILKKQDTMKHCLREQINLVAP